MPEIREEGTRDGGETSESGSWVLFALRPEYRPRQRARRETCGRQRTGSDIAPHNTGRAVYRGTRQFSESGTMKKTPNDGLILHKPMEELVWEACLAAFHTLASTVRTIRADGNVRIHKNDFDDMIELSHGLAAKLVLTHIKWLANEECDENEDACRKIAKLGKRV